MTPRERFLACMHFEPVDHVPDLEFGYWDETFPVWHEQGLPKWVTNIGLADHYFGFEPHGGFPIGVGLVRGFEYAVVEEHERYRIIRDGEGVLLKQFTDGSSSIPHYLEFPLKTRRDWEDTFLPRLPLDQPVPDWLPDWKAKHRERDIPIQMGVGSLYGWIRNWMGLEGISIAIGTEPEWVDEMMGHLCELTCRRIEATVELGDLDYASMWEDMSANHGPLISPRMFRAFMTPKLKRITDMLKARGVDIVMVDSDGNINVIIEPWLEGGVNLMFPLEINGSMDPAALRAQYGRRLLMRGGVDKGALRHGKAAIDAMLETIVPVVAEGAFIPGVDHRVPPDVSYEDYLYYLKRKRELLGIPEPPYGEPPKE